MDNEELKPQCDCCCNIEPSDLKIEFVSVEPTYVNLELVGGPLDGMVVGVPCYCCDGSFLDGTEVTISDGESRVRYVVHGGKGRYLPEIFSAPVQGEES